MAGAVAFLFLLLAVPTAFATDYTVGGSSGWSTNVDYTTWTSGKTFNVGDTLVFTYGGSHTVDEVPKSDYDSCTANNVINSYSDGNTRISLNRTGAHYFLCQTPGHCSQGMKLTVSVSTGSSLSPSGSPFTPTSSSGPTSSTPKNSGATATGWLFGVSLVLAPLLVFVS